MATVGTDRHQQHDPHHEHPPHDEHDDLLSELLKPLRLTGVFDSRWHVRAPWAIEGDAERSCAVLHYVVEGDCWITTDDETPVELHAGDLVVFPTGTAHRLSDRPDRQGVPLKAVLPEREPGTSGEIVIEGSGPESRLLCAGLHYDASAATGFYTSLPWALVLDGNQVDREPLLRELAGNPASLPLLRHPGISRAVVMMATRFPEPWTIDSLAREVGMSRSAFTAAFRDLVGESPARYLAARRMQEAGRLLTETSLPQSAVPARVGYQSAVGFHLAFRKWFGVTPGEYRAGVARAA